MNLYKNIYFKINENNLFFFLYIPVTAMLFLWGFMLVYYPEIAAEGVKEGINICSGTVIPSLFPFLLFSSLLSESGILNFLTGIAERFARTLFALPGVSIPIIFMSLIGGFPIGAFLIKRAFENGELTASQGRRMLMFCVNPGPAFTISAVGTMLIGSKKAGVIIYASTVIASIFLGIFTRFVAPKEDTYKTETEKATEKKEMYTVISSSVSSCTHAILNICIWIVIFSCLNKLVESLPLNQSFVLFFKSFSEVTNGVITALVNYPLPIVSGVISFAGICVHLQLLPCLVTLKLKYKYFLTVRIVAASLSIVVSYLLYNIFPVSINTVLLGTRPTDIGIESSFPVCVCLLVMCGLFIIGDNYIFTKKRTNQIDN